MRRELRAGLKRALDALLAPHGFHVDGFTWRRRAGELIDVIAVEWGKKDTQDDYRFTITCGVVWPPAFEAAWEKPVPAALSDTECTVKSRIGLLVDGHDRWWISKQQTDEQMVADARATLERAGLAFFDKMHALPAMEAFLGRDERHLKYPPDVIALATIREALGDVEGARRILSERVNRPVSARTPKSAWSDLLERRLNRLSR